jgi:hypothetical protein
MTFTRPYKWWRTLNPLNIIGSMNGYASCDCGNSLWLGSSGYDTSSHGGTLICKACGEEFKDAIKSNDHLIEGGGSRCSDKDCKLHSNNPRFTYVDGLWCSNAWKDRDYYGRYLKDGWGTHIRLPEDKK